MKYTYDIRQFNWNSNKNSFYAAAPFLECLLPDGNIHPEAFPNNRGEFFIHNYKTDGFRRFQFVEEIVSEFEETQFTQIEWVFKSEDGIHCHISLD